MDDPPIDGPNGNLGHMLNVNILLCKTATLRQLKIAQQGGAEYAY